MYPKVTEHIPDIIALIRKLVDLKVAYLLRAAPEPTEDTLHPQTAEPAAASTALRQPGGDQRPPADAGGAPDEGRAADHPGTVDGWKT